MSEFPIDEMGKQVDRILSGVRFWRVFPTGKADAPLNREQVQALLIAAFTAGWATAVTARENVRSDD